MKTITYTALGFVALMPAIVSACIGDLDRGYGIMGYGGGATFMVMGGLIWTVVGILAGVWLWQNINKK